ncbi:hypothetical protein [Streptomyces lydicus]|uniref:hypothetical protein n=1 Tax=Streptomyces lydicus TaxID=47763 RepID=UPI0037A1FCB9
MSNWGAERDRIHSAVATAVHDIRGDMLLNMVVIGVTVNDQGEKLLSCWTSPDQRQWETIGLLEYVRMDHGAHLAERRIANEDEQ